MMRCKGVRWYSYQGMLLPETPPHQEIVLSKKEQGELLQKSQAYLLRWISDWDGIKSEFWYVIKDRFSGLDELSSNTRSKVRRGLKNCSVLKVLPEDIAQDGYEVYVSAMNNYKTSLNIISEKEFSNNKLNSESYDIWAVYEKNTGKMIAYSSNKIQKNSCNYTEIKFHPKYLKLYSSYALFYEMNRYYLEEKNFLYVNDGARSIAHETNIQSFLIDKFKFRKAYCQLNIAYRKDIAIIVKVLYPFQTVISKLNFSITNKIAVLLKQEEIRRSFA